MLHRLGFSGRCLPITMSGKDEDTESRREITVLPLTTRNHSERNISAITLQKTNIVSKIVRPTGETLYGLGHCILFFV